MAANKKKKGVKVRDLKPSKDAKGGGVKTVAARPLGVSPQSAAAHSNLARPN